MKSDGSRALWLGFYTRYIGQRHPDVQVRHRPEGNILLVDGVTPGNREDPVRYCPVHRCWYGSGRDFCHAEILHDGRVMVAYVDDTEDEGSMVLHVAHPHEALEIIDLLHHPIADFTGNKVSIISRSLSSLADIRILLPCDGKWRAWDPSIASGTPGQEFASAMVHCLRAGESHWQAKPGHRANAICARWPEQVSSMMDAESILQGGYVLTGAGGIESAMRLSIDISAVDFPYAKLLLLPKEGKVSWLYLREYLAGDQDAGAALEAMIASLHRLDDLNMAIRNIAIQIPEDYLDQVRVAAEINMTRQWLLDEADWGSKKRRQFNVLLDGYWTAADALCRFRNEIQQEAAT